MTNDNGVLRGSGLVLLAVGLMTTAHAQAPEPATAPAESTASSIEEVTVTAQRQVSTAQKTPIAMEVFDGKALAAAGVSNVQELSNLAPGLSFTEVDGESNLSLRGISSNDTTEIGDPAVVISSDGFFVNRPYALNYAFYDVSRVEVLKGPQGTLYGRNAVGGVVNILTAQPVDQFAASTSVEYGSFNTVNVSGMVNLPLTDDLAIRTAFLTQRHDGYRDNTVTGISGLTQRGDDEDSQSARIEVAYHPGDHFRGLVTFQFLHAGGVGSVEYETPWVFDSAGYLVQSKPNIPNAENFPVQAPASLDTTDYQTRWQFSYEGLPYGLTATYLGGFDKLVWHHSSDESPPGEPTNFVQNEYPDTTNQELRLASAPDKRLTWQAGFFYFEEDSHNLYSYSQPIGGTPLIAFNFPLVKSASVAEYGQASFNITDTVKITGGARYTADKKSRDGTFTLFFLPGPPALSQYGKTDSSKTTFHGALEWSPTAVNLLYAKYDTGYKAGGFNSGGAGPADYLVYAPETLKAYDFGSKNRFLNDTLQLNVDLFHYDYTDLQVLQYVPTFASGSSVTNAKGAKINGVEVQGTALLGAIGRVDAEVDYLDAYYTDFLDGPVEPLNPALFPNCSGPLGAQNCQLKGNTLPHSPRFTMVFGFKHDFDVRAGTLTAGVNTRFVTKQYFDAFNLPDTTQSSYNLTNLDLTFSPNSGKSELQAYVRNIGNTVIFTDAELYGAGGTNAYQYAFAPPRTFGIRYTQRF